MNSTCPACKSTNTKDASIRENNGIYGPGAASWVVEEKSICNDCGVYFKPMANEPTIEEKNREMFDFLELKHSEQRDIDEWEMKTLKYHEDWNQLMRVVKKIHTLKKHNPDGKDLCLMSQLTISMDMDGYYNRCRCSILGHITHCYTLSIPHNYETVDLPSIFVHDKNTLIEAVYEAVYQFITWYNQQKQTK